MTTRPQIHLRQHQPGDLGDLGEHWENPFG